MRIIFFFLLIPLNILHSQLNLPVNDSVQNFLFAKSTLGTPIIITENGMFEYLSDWEYISFADNSFKKELDNLDQLNHANFFTIINSKELYIISNGAGPVFVFRDNTFKRIDNSSLHKNQFGGARFIYNNKIHIYGGYGFWSFKSFITFFDENINQWDLVYNESKYTPPGRWKPIYTLINDKFYVLGGRSGLAGSVDQDESFSDVFYFDFTDKEFVNVGKLNPKIRTSYSLFSYPKIEDNILILNNTYLTKIDFKNLTFTNYSKAKAFSGIDNKYPTFVNNQTLFYISDVNGEKLLNSFDISSIGDSFNSESFSLIENRNNLSIKNYILFGLFIALIFWLILKIFSFKDFIKGLILYDEKNIYYNNDSASIKSNEKALITYLSEKPFITASQVNAIISDQQFAKSHFTSLRNRLLNELNEKLFKLTNIQKCIIEIKNPKDNRIKAYKVNSSIIKKKISFLSFLFKT